MHPLPVNSIEIPALLIIDMQQGIQRVSTPRNNPQAETQIAQLLEYWRTADLPLVHIRHMSRQADSVFAPGQSGALFQPALAPRANEQVFEKNITDAFAHSGLERWLHARTIRRLVIVGVASENSVEATARSASCLGFMTQVVADACYTFDKTDYHGHLRSASDVHAMAMANLRDEYADVLKPKRCLIRYWGANSDQLECAPAFNPEKSAMHMFSVLRDSWYFFSHNLLAITRLCLPLIVLEGLFLQQVSSLAPAQSADSWRLLAGLLFYPLYSAALILFLDARSNGLQPHARDLLAAALRLWPRFALLAAIMTVAILLGASLYVLPGIWLIVKLAFAEYLLVLRGMPPLKALQESFAMSTGYFWPMLGCVLIVMLPLWLLDAWSQTQASLADDSLLSLLMDCTNRFLQLFSSVVLFRLFMLRSTQPDVE